MPSRQLAAYFTLRESGATVEAAAEQSGIGLTEARFTEQAIEKGEPSCAPAPARTHEDEPTKEMEMARDNETVRATETVAADQLRLFVERIERLSEERKGIADDIADVYGEAKANGYDKPTMRRIVRLRAMEPHHREEAAALLETYASALGLQGALPL